ncbi:plasminogen-like [Pecten maximus]|uniref:plasminogen-like n=1 Tax=Pecten maximus TaxID=6579 RepID=UPI001458EF5B|nr:plasminogen-like [Pecten maximus]
MHDKLNRKQIRKKRDKNILEEKDMDLTVWFPGWMPSLVNREPSSTPGHECVALSRQYTLPNGSVENVSYYYWKAVECVNAEGLLSYICEKPRQYTSGGTSQECYTDTGEEYRGNVHVTKDGLPCQNWTLYRNTNPDTNSDRGLGNHNLCRNPDGDVSPWCWTNVTTEEFAYCAIPQCHIRNSSKSRLVVQECPKGQFYCHKSSQGRCIASMYQCDGETDCEHSEDETGCDYILPRFTKIENMLSKATVRKTFGTIPVELCAKLCYEEKKFTCKSFSYRKTWKYCYLSSEEDPVDSRSSSADYDMYVLK